MVWKHITAKIYVYVFVIICMAIVFSSKLGNCQMENSMVVKFDPYVSILDKSNYSRYNVAELKVLVAKVATRFSRIYIELRNDDFNSTETSLMLSPLATAEYNCLLETTKKLEVWLGMTHESISSRQIIDKHLEQMILLAKNVNSICNDTITTILLPVQHFTQIKNVNDSFNINQNKMPEIENLKLGALLKDLSNCNKIIGLTKPQLIVFPGNMINSNLQQALNRCRSENEKQNHTASFAVMFGFSDSQADNTVNTTFLVTRWKEAIDWAKSSGNTIILSNAFDTPYKRLASERTMGWWRLLENSNYTTTNDYIFEEKISIANQIDMMENSSNFEWLENQINFYTKTTGLIFRKNNVGKKLSYEMKKTFFQNEYLRILLFEDKVFQKNLNESSHKSDAILMTTSNISYADIKEYPKNISYLSNFTVYFPFALRNTEIVQEFKKAYEKYKNLKMSYSFNINLCNWHLQNESNLLEIISKAENSAIIFYFKEDPETIKLGARRMFEQRRVLLEHCLKMVTKTGNHNVEIGFALWEYPKPEKFEKSPFALQNFVRYWNLLNDWAFSQNNVVIFLQALDREASEGNTASLGWWKLEESQDSSSGPPQITLLDKRAEALKASRPSVKQNLLSSSENTNYSIFIAVSVAIGIITISISIFFIKRHNSKEPLSKEELDQFFNGDSSGDQAANSENSSRVPYDAEKYEIDEGKYSFDDDSVLGAGEFGQVLRGKVEMAEGELISVAIKTTNPLTQHVSALKGMLSEVKLLAYIGKHANITELIGANTSKLNRGKILIFLELCHLGSLQKFLRQIEVQTRSQLVEPQEPQNSIKYSYENFGRDGDRIILDSELSEDLFRWSIEICSGMAYLAEKFVVHADLATRNVLINIRKQAKICDFGLSRRMYNYTDYVKSGREPLPWKWMAPESLRFMQFSEKSDVWAFGITLWEMYTLGETPYQGLSWDVNFSLMLEQGLRPSEPKYNENEMYEIMKDCWKTMSDQRPTFSDILKKLESRTQNKIE